MFTAYAETAATTTTKGNPIIGYIVIIAAIAFFVFRHLKKKGAVSKKAKQLSASVTVSDAVTNTTRSSRSRSSTNKFTGDFDIVSIAQFQKVAYEKYVVLDLETTGLDSSSDRIIEVAAVRVVKGKIMDKYHTLVNPEMAISADAVAVHGITDKMVSKSPVINQVLPDLLAFLGDDMIAAHNAKFDAAFLTEACQREGLSYPRRYFDTMRLSVYWPNAKGRKLSDFLEAANIKNKSAHRSLGDATATASLIIASMDKIAG